MIGKCFGILCCLSVIYGIFSGNLAGINEGILEGAEKSVSTVISLLGIMAFWQGIMRVFEKSGVIKIASLLLAPVLKLVFPRAYKEKNAIYEISACVSANMLGIANASTPLALSAIEKMNEGRKSESATNDMITLAIIGSSSFCLIPTTIIAVRSSLGAHITYELIVPVWIISGACMLFGIILSRIAGKIFGDT